MVAKCTIASAPATTVTSRIAITPALRSRRPARELTPPLMNRYVYRLGITNVNPFPHFSPAAAARPASLNTLS